MMIYRVLGAFAFIALMLTLIMGLGLSIQFNSVIFSLPLIFASLYVILTIIGKLLIATDIGISWKWFYHAIGKKENTPFTWWQKSLESFLNHFGFLKFDFLPIGKMTVGKDGKIKSELYVGWEQISEKNKSK